VPTSTIVAKLCRLCYIVLFTFFVKRIMKKSEREGTSRLRIGRQGAGQAGGRQLPHTI
jgi:hypothetical protein